VASASTESAHLMGDGGEEPLDITRPVGCKQLVPHILIRSLTDGDTAYTEPQDSLVEIVWVLQLTDHFTIEKHKAFKKAVQSKSPAKLTPWAFDAKGVLCYNSRLYVPNEGAIWVELLSHNHDDLMVGHFGKDRTLELIGWKYHWSGLASDVWSYCTTCDICQWTKVPRHKPYGKLNSLPISKVPWKQITMDFITGLPPSKHHRCIYDAILVDINHCIKMAWYI